MMNIAFRTISLRKRFPLSISRGTSTGSDNLFVSLTRNGITGWGEMAPGIAQDVANAAAGQAALTEFFTDQVAQLSIRQIHALGCARKVLPCALAALDIALWDWAARNANVPLYQLLGMGIATAPTSITLGISSPETVRERIPLLLKGNHAQAPSIQALKVKLGSAQGIEADQAMFAAVLESTRKHPLKVRVDANGGWNVAEAQVMMKWLAEREVEYVEQPLPEGLEQALPTLFKHRPLPIFVDESCRFAADIPHWAHAVDGVNVKLMKCGGITGALQIFAVARAFNLKTMLGCMSESSLSISAAAALSGEADYVDLDSHLNLASDPCVGAQLQDGIVKPSESPGHGATITHA